MKTFLRIALGCLVLPIAIGLVLIIAGVAMRQAGPPEHRDETASLEQSLPGVTLGQLQSEGLAAGAPSGRAVAVDLLLEEGNFTVLAGPPGSSIRVEGAYDAGAYELKQEMTRDGSGHPSYSLSFRPRWSMFRRMMTEGGVHLDKDDNKITVYLPRGVPIALNAQASKGTSDLRLGGLALQAVTLDLSMGEHSLSVDELNPLQMDRMEARASMGETHLKGLGNLRAGEIELWGKMGEFVIDMGERIDRDTKLVARMRFGEMSLHVPPDARVKSHTSVFLADANGKLSDDTARTGHLLEIDSAASFGEVNYQRN